MGNTIRIRVVKRYLIPIFMILVLTSAAVGCGERANPNVDATPSEALPSPQRQSVVEQTAEEKTEHSRMELVEKLQQVNDALSVNMEQIFEVTDNINRLYGNINSLMQRDQRIMSDLNDRSLNEMMGPVPGWRSSLLSTIDNDQHAISSYNFKIAENRIKLKELQDKQLELEKERNLLLTELAKLD